MQHKNSVTIVGDIDHFSLENNLLTRLAIEPLSARRLVHVLVDLGKIAKSTQQQQQQRPAASPVILPEDREVNDIMTQRRAVGVSSSPSHQQFRTKTIRSSRLRQPMYIPPYILIIGINLIDIFDLCIYILRSIIMP